MSDQETYNLIKQLRDYQKKVTVNGETALAALIRAGLVTPDGEPTPPYRSQCLGKENRMVVELTKNELKIIADCLEAHSDVLGNNTCNDSFLPDTDENWELLDKIQKADSDDPDEWRTREELSYNGGLFVADFVLPAYFSEKLRALIKEQG